MSVAETHLLLLEKNNFAMYFLLGWGIISIALGVFFYFKLDKLSTWRYFWQMNALWNVVNIAIAAAALFGNHQEAQELFTDPADLRAKLEFLRIALWFNLGLNVSYMAIGLFLRERGLRYGRKIMLGWGFALVLQGLFLFLFDIVQLISLAPLAV